MIVVQPGERNAFDQRWIEYQLLDGHGVKLIRRTLSEIDKTSRIDPNTNALYIKTLSSEVEVSVTYFRAGYGPGDYPSEKEWSARLTIELSKTVKCPNIAYQLAGTKKIQQVLANPGVVERFLPEVDAAKLRACFTGLFPLDSSEEGEKATRMAISQPAKYVMKPQREGGGNNIYGQEIADLLKKLSPTERNAYILMELIKPPPLKNILVREGEHIEADVISELGIYGIWVSRGDEVHLNEPVGHLLRTKSSTTNEGGVAAGFAVIDSPLLV
ncbi:glutathione synthase [Paraphysoderma sedebokerense]|nr:glutathione synthase [Paraphysoderma sedebokerense]